MRVSSRAVLIGAGAAALVLQILAIERQSLIGDAAYHLVAGEQALRYGRNTLNLEHPPLVKLVAALPLLAGPPVAPPTEVDRAMATAGMLFEDPARLPFVRRWSRILLLVCFGIPLLLACGVLGTRVTGRREAGFLLALAMALSLSVLPSLSVIQTDTAMALGFVLTVVTGLGYAKRPTARAALKLGASAGLAVAAKYSGVLVLPAAVLAIAMGRSRPVQRRLLDGALATAVALATAWVPYAVANRHYEPEIGRDTIRHYCSGRAMLVADRMQSLEPALLATESHAPNLAQWLTGLAGIAIQDEIGVYASYAFGRIDSRGRWWYFPALLAVKTPLALLAASALGVAAFLRRRPAIEPLAFLLPGAAVVVHLAAAVTSSYNLGVRHLMPVMPFLFLPAVAWASERRGRVAALGGILAAEAVALCPLWMSATNTWWLGEWNPTRFALSAGNSDYRQNFLELQRVSRRSGRFPLHVVYPLVDPREIRAWLPDAVVVGLGDEVEPGWYAVSVRVEQYVPAILSGSPAEIHDHEALLGLARRWQPLWEQIAAGEDFGYVAGTFHLYRHSR